MKAIINDTKQDLKRFTSVQFVTVPAGTCVFEKEDKRDCAYLIQSGNVQIQNEGREPVKTPLAVLGNGEIFGEMALIEEGNRTASAISVTECRLIKILPEILYERISGLDPLVGLLLSMLVDRYRQNRIGETDKKEAAKQHIIEKGPDGSDMKPRLGAFSMASVLRSSEETLKELRLEQDLITALEKNQFTAALQPVINLQERSIQGFEALIRWEHPEHGFIMPDHFIPVAERMGLIMEIDMMMFGNAASIARQINEIAGDPNGDLYIAVNLSGFNFATGEITKRIEEIVSADNSVHKQIRLEITESALVGDPEMAESVLGRLKKQGLRIALDDFGTGYSSLSYLHRFSIDTLKIDRAFVKEMHSSSKSLDIVRAIIGLAQTFQLDLIAEGIEHEEDALMLNALGCENGQGYYFSKPMAVNAAIEYTHDHMKSRG